MGVPATAFITDPAEWTVAAMLFIGLIPLLRLWRRKHRATWFLTAYALLFLSAAATIIEAYTFPVVFNYVEHVAAMTSGAAFLYYLRQTEQEVEQYGR